MRLVWSERAEDDLQRIYEFNVTRTEAWAERVEARIRQRMNDTLATPKSGRAIGATDVRVISLPDIQYLVQYRLDGDELTVLRVFSTRERQ